MDEKKSRHTARRHHAQARLAVRLHQHADDVGQLWLPNFDMNEQVKMNKHIPENLASFKDDISKQKHWMQPVSEEECEQHAGFMAYTRLDPEVGFMRKSEKYFVITDRCIGCGVCTDNSNANRGLYIVKQGGNTRKIVSNGK